jgi:hypothetical protein
VIRSGETVYALVEGMNEWDNEDQGWEKGRESEVEDDSMIKRGFA